ncbi:MAG: hypothetical protein IJF54_03010 [Clostridia bacterium]|nr:hypothetical protein [Clostridia bacterium]
MNIIKTANTVLKKQRLTAALSCTIPLCLTPICVIAEYLILIYLFPAANAYVKLAITGVILLLNLLILRPVSLGKKNWFLKLYTKADGSVLNIFHFYESFGLFCSAAALWLLKRVYIAAICLIVFVPSIIMFRYFSSLALPYGVFLSILTFITGFLLVLKSLTSLFLCDYLLISECQNPFKAFYFSLVKMRRHRTELIMLILKFWWRIFSCIFIFPLFHTVPLFCQSMAVFADKIITSASDQKSSVPPKFLHYQKNL